MQLEFFMESKMVFSQGSLFGNILFFSLPLIFTNLLQVFFSMTDIAVLGRFAGAEAMGSVGSVAILVFMCTGILTGFGAGVNAIAAFYIGAKNEKNICETVHTSAIVSFSAGIFICLLGIVFVRPVLELMGTKNELIEGSVIYFKIYMTGMPALAFYNFGNGILSADGDTKSPMRFLFISGMFNVVLDLLFVISFRMDIAGVAVASVVAQYVSAVLVFIKLYRKKDALALRFRKLKITENKLFRLLKIGIPAGMQNAIFAFANIFIQVGINSFDASMVIANSAASNSDPLVYNVMSAFYVACSTSIAQNYGAGKKERILKSCFISMGYAFFSAAVLGGLLLIFGRNFISIFTEDSHIIDLGMKRLTIMAFSYCISSFMDTTIAASRGLGQTMVPTVIVILGSCVFRIVWIYTVFAYFKTIESLYLLFAFSWIITAAAEMAYFIKLYKKSMKELETN